jgi:phosphocarrier protein
MRTASIYRSSPTAYHASVAAVEAKVEVKNRLGLHLRAASTLAQALKPFAASITLAKGNQRVNAKSVINLVTLGASLGTKLTVKAEGADAQQAVATLEQLFESRFGED